MTAGEQPGREPGTSEEPTGEQPGQPVEAPAAVSLQQRDEPDKPAGRGSFFRELPVLVIVALVLALLIKAFLVQAFFIPSGSMEKTLHGCTGCNGDRVLVNKFIYRFRAPHRGEVIVFNGVDSWTPESTVPQSGNVVERDLRKITSAVGVTAPSQEDFIKRVIGVPGDVVKCCDARGRVTVNGHPLTEPYVYQDNHQAFGPITVPKGRLWVMGDHRGFSADSRAHLGDPGGGAISEAHVVGRAFMIIWPVHRITLLRVPATFHQAGLSGTADAALGATAPAAPLTGGVLGAGGLALARRRRRRGRRRP